MSKKTAKPEADTEQEIAHIAADSAKKTFPVVGIGASAGGLSACTELLKALPGDTGMGFVLVQHLDPKHASMLPELLGRTTSMPVIEISDGVRVEPNCVYVMPPNHSYLLHLRSMKCHD